MEKGPETAGGFGRSARGMGKRKRMGAGKKGFQG